MKDKFLKIIFFLSMVLNISVLAATGFFFYRHYRFSASPYARMSKSDRPLLEKIPLRPDQVKTLKEKSEAFRSRMDKKMLEIVDERKTLFYLLLTDSPDKEKVNGVIDKINKIQRDMQMDVASHILEEKSLMDSGQKERFFELLEKSLEKRRRG